MSHSPVARQSAWTTFRTLGLIGSLRYTRVKWLTATEQVFPISRLGMRYLIAPQALHWLHIRRGTDDLAGYVAVFIERRFGSLLPACDSLSTVPGAKPFVIDACPEAGFAAVAFITRHNADVLAFEAAPGTFLALRSNVDPYGEAARCVRGSILDADVDGLTQSRPIELLRVRAEDAIALAERSPDWFDRVRRVVVDHADQAMLGRLRSAGYRIDLHGGVVVLSRATIVHRAAA